MSWKPDYLDLDDLKEALRITDTNDDVMLAFAITAASRAIDHHCGRQFGALSVAAPRYYTPQIQEVRPARLRWAQNSGYWHRYIVAIDDLMTTTNLVVKSDPDGDGLFDTTLTLDVDYRLAPFNAAADALPWTYLVPILKANAVNGLWFPNLERSIQITALWGWTAVPAVVTQACLIQAARFFMRRQAPFGVAGSPDLGSQLRLLSKLDPDVAVLLSSVRSQRAFA